MEAKDLAEVYRHMSNTFLAMDPRYQVGPAGAFSYSDQQAAMWSAFSSAGHALKVMADAFDAQARKVIE